MKLLLVGSDDQAASLLELLEDLEGVELLAVVGAASHNRTRQLAQELLVPFEIDVQALARHHEVECIVNASDNPTVGQYLRLHKPRQAQVLDGHNLDLLLQLATRLQTLRSEADKYRAVRLQMEYEDNDNRIIGKSEAMEQVRELIRRVGPTPTSVLLLGETGVGKDLVARSIHHVSPLRDKPFVTINCTALSASLMESELFGYKKGAFTGAEHDRKGLLEEAHGGALFLDEIGDMQIELQAKLLRFLQTGEIRRVGSTRLRTVEVRIIAATNRNLEEAVEQGQFRRDLFFRFNTFAIKLPPLRERREDIPYLAYHFLTKAEAKLNKHVQGIDDAALEALHSYHWPGNVRELENVMERAVILCQNASISPADLALPACPTEQPRQALQTLPPSPPQTSPGETAGTRTDFRQERQQLLDSFERNELLGYLKEAEGNVSEACRKAGIPRRTFYRLMRKHGL